VGILDDIFWKALTGRQAHFASGAGAARRYARGFSPILGFEDREHPDFAALAPFCDPGERFYVDSWSGPAPPGWDIVLEKTMKRMVWTGELPAQDEALQARPLAAAHAQQAVDLAVLTNPGPFGLRTIELGDYFGVFEGGRLVAMAGERMHAGPYREVSGVCTHPDFQGRGLARRLTATVVRLQMQRAQLPFLHVISSNTGAHDLYERMGFRDYCETVVRVVERTA
jgi:ribosomal protein S18 acetylase RimI-like enzyme